MREYITGGRAQRNALYRELLVSEPIEIEGVEDSERGLRAAVAAGLDCADVHHPFTAAQDFSLATHRVASLAELAERLLHGPAL